jgi:hypothetical protein
MVRPTGRGLPQGPETGELVGTDGGPDQGLPGRTSSRSDLAESQVSRIVDALRLLLVDLAHVPVGKGVDWNRC